MRTTFLNGQLWAVSYPCMAHDCGLLKEEAGCLWQPRTRQRPSTDNTPTGIQKAKSIFSGYRAWRESGRWVVKTVIFCGTPQVVDRKVSLR